MTHLTLLATRVIVWMADPTPTAPPAYEGDPNLITPGVVGFAVTFLIALAAVLLAVSMVRRVRRVTYRAEVREELEAEAAGREPGADEPQK